MRLGQLNAESKLMAISHNFWEDTPEPRNTFMFSLNYSSLLTKIEIDVALLITLRGIG
jgi:hypothetical protein